MKFFEALERESNKTTTEKGAVSYKSTMNKNLDFFSQASSMRTDQESAKNLLAKAFGENEELALKNIFFLRDARMGSGERNLFKVCLSEYLRLLGSDYDEEKIKKLFELIPEYGRWDDLIYLETNSNVYEKIKFEVIKTQLESDIENCKNNKPISLLAKWFPLKNNTKNLNKLKYATKLCRYIFEGDYKKARKTIGELRTYLDVLEKKMSRNMWSEIDYEKVPSKASLKYVKAFYKHDADRYGDYIDEVKQGKKKINSSVIEPYEIVSEVIKRQRIGIFKDEKFEVYDEMWKALPDKTNGSKSICVVDVSGSMYGGNPSPIDVAVSLGLYFAERNKSKDFRNKFITFSQKPELVEINENDTFHEKILKMTQSSWGMNTDIIAVFDLILKSAVKHKLSQDDMPDNIYIISDMQFDCCAKNNNKTPFDYIDKKYKKKGYKRPTLIFWNVNARSGNIPALSDTGNVVLMSGFSKNLFAFATENKTPEQFMLDILLSERYNGVHL